jgi:hypothetical protein
MVLDSRRTGFIAGMIAPVLGFLAYGLIYTNAIRPMYDMRWFVSDLFLGTLKYTSSILSLSLIADAFLFFWFDRRDAHRSMRGVILAMMVYGVVVVALILVEKLINWGVIG